MSASPRTFLTPGSALAVVEAAPDPRVCWAVAGRGGARKSPQPRARQSKPRRRMNSPTNSRWGDAKYTREDGWLLVAGCWLLVLVLVAGRWSRRQVARSM